MAIAISYYRVSTVRQGRSGLGLEAQQIAVRNYCTMNVYDLIREIEEVKSTRKRRLGLEEALELCRLHKATLMVARLDRLGRDVEQIARIIKSDVEIVVTDNPHANRFTIHILAAVAEEQRRTISENTRSALQAAKRKGKELGKNGKKLSKENREAAYLFAKQLEPVIHQLANEGYTSMRMIAEQLTKRSIPTFRGNENWHLKSVHNILKRLRTIQLDSDIECNE